MTKSLLQQHKEDLEMFIHSLGKGILPEEHNLSDETIVTLRNKLRNAKGVEEMHSERHGKSYTHALRAYLEDVPPKLFYRDALRVIEEVTRPRFEKEYANYSSAVRAYLRYKAKENLEASAEVRAYFEYRFYHAIEQFFSKILPEHKLTLILLLWSFQGNQILPAYRMNINISPNNEADDALYKRRGEDFENLNELRKEYSYVWDIVNNNITTILYFDKVEGKSQMTVYEIDPDVEPGRGSVIARYSGKSTFSTEHRSPEDADVVTPESVLINSKETFAKFQRMRNSSREERDYQYQVIRFFIRMGIFNPRDAAYALRPFEPAFTDLLKNADQTIKDIVEEQYNTSTGKIPSQKEDESDIQYKEHKEKARHRGNAFRHNEKYNFEDDQALDKVIDYLDKNEPESINIRIAIFEAGFFYLTKDNASKISDIYWMPVLLNWRGRHVGGAVFINSDQRIVSTESDKTPGKPIEKQQHVPQKIISTLYFLSGLFGDKQIGEIEESIRPAQERAAAVSIMSRNISHNLGSHVLSYLRNRFSDEGLMLRAGILENIVKSQDKGGGWEVNTSLLKEQGKCAIDESKFTAPYLRSLGQLLGYFQERQDYIGTLASDWYVYYSPVNFSRDVADFFSARVPIKAGSDHTTHNLILDFIAHSEEYEYKDIKIEWFWNNRGGSPGLPTDKAIALPSGITGRQGIYTILENFMRNSAKHGSPKQSREEGKLHITFTISDFKNPDYYKVELRDNSNNADEKIIKTIKSVLRSPLIGLDGNPDEHHKGIKEIQIAAAWLRGIRPSDLLDVYAHDGLEVLQVDNNNNNLCYTFYLRKPKPALFIVKDRSRYYDATGKLLNAYKHLSDWDIVEYRPGVYSPELINRQKAPYKFVLLHKEFEEDRETLREVRTRNPVRILTGIADHSLAATPNPEEWLYKKWLDGKEKASKDDQDKTLPRFALAFSPEQPVENSTWPIGIEDDSQPPVSGEASKYVVTDPVRAQEQLILFRRHNDTAAMFKDFRENPLNRERYDKYVFLEGITGNNSTGRLLRDEKKDGVWHLKLLEAALTKILILDERVWKNLRNEAVIDFETQYEHLRKKNIYILNLEKRDGQLTLVNLLDQEIATVDEEGDITFLPGEHEALYSRFHFISLHQGLLDRVMKHCEKHLNAPDNKELADQLFKKFKQKFWATFRCVIHSGRSKTPTLPAHSAFVQFSSLYTAFQDCKLTLCDLLYSTIEEY